jgi:hypothetical protein
MVYKFKSLAPFSELTHFVSTRHGGVSVGEKAGLNLSFNVGDEVAHVIENRRILAETIGLTSAQFVFPTQTHSSNVKIISTITATENLAETDALVTNVPTICLSVMSADCVPILLFDPVNKVIAAIHAGWRGTVAGIVTKTIEVMTNEFGTKAPQIIACIGPSISEEVYQVGEEVIKAVSDLFGTTEGLIAMKNENSGMFNLWEANRQLLLKSGVLANQIEVAGICTFKNSDTFFSYRKSPQTGRFAAGICLLKYSIKYSQT